MFNRSSLSRLPSRAVATLLLHACTFAAAPSVAEIPSPPTPSQTQPLHLSGSGAPGHSADISEWPDASSIPAGRKLKLVTMAARRRERSCKVASIDSSQIACAESFGRKPRVFQQEEISAIYNPAHSSGNHRDLAICASIAGAIVTGAVFLGVKVFPYGLIGSIPMGLLGVAVLGACGMADDESQYTPAQVLYLQPGQPLPHPLH